MFAAAPTLFNIPSNVYIVPITIIGGLSFPRTSLINKSLLAISSTANRFFGVQINQA
jgi:hypothetical protein